jgi:hypothetical protein
MSRRGYNLSGFKGGETWSQHGLILAQILFSLSLRYGLADILGNARCSCRFMHQGALDRTHGEA